MLSPIYHHELSSIYHLLSSFILCIVWIDLCIEAESHTLLAFHMAKVDIYSISFSSPSLLIITSNYNINVKAFDKYYGSSSDEGSKDLFRVGG